MGVAAIFGIFAATYFWFPKMFGRMLNETLGKMHFWLTFVGVYCIFMPMHFLGLAGHPRRYADTTGVNFLAPLHSVHYFITIAAMITITAQLHFPVQFLLQHVRRQESHRKSVERDDAGVVHSLAAAVR